MYEFLGDARTTVVSGLTARTAYTVVVQAINDVGLGQPTVVLAPETLYDFVGFLPPVNNPLVVNSTKAGSAIPVKFSLRGDYGLDIFTTGYPKSRAVACDSGAPLDPIKETATAGASGLSYDAASDQYTYVWKTSKQWRSTCRELTLRLKDGTEHKVLVKLT